jgi:hypothetical protein
MQKSGRGDAVGKPDGSFLPVACKMDAIIAERETGQPADEIYRASMGKS